MTCCSFSCMRCAFVVAEVCQLEASCSLLRANNVDSLSFDACFSCLLAIFEMQLKLDNSLVLYLVGYLRCDEQAHGLNAVGTVRTVQSHIDMEGRHLPITVAVSGHTPDRFLRLPADTQALAAAGPLPAPVPDAAVQAYLLFPGDSALRINWRHLVYTDGSAPAARNGQTGHDTNRRTGSRVYRPAEYMQDGSQQDELCVRLEPLLLGA
jgi:hypothetical protein